MSLSKFPSDSLLMTLLTKWKHQYSDFIRNRSGRCYCVYGWCVCMVHIRGMYAQCVCGVCLHVEGDRGWCLISSSVALHLGIWDKVSHGTWSSVISEAGWLMSSRELPVSVSPGLGLQTCVTIPGFYMGAGDWSWGLHTFVTGTLSLEPSPQLPKEQFWSNGY